MISSVLRTLLASALLSLACCTAHPQLFESTHAKKDEGQLSAKEQQVVERLASLNTLPTDEWRFHAGDVPHGESPQLDDSSWQTAHPKTTAPREAVWYRRVIEVPKSLHGYDLTGARVWFRFRAFANGPMPQIIYFNGRRVAMGDDLEPIVLFDDARPGDKVLVAVKLLPTVDEKRFAGVETRIEFASARPNPDDLRKEFLSSAALLPSLEKDPAADEAAMAKAADQVDLTALDGEDQAKFDASLRQAQQSLQPLRPALQQATLPPHRQLAYRRRVALAVDRNRRCGEAHLRHRGRS